MLRVDLNCDMGESFGAYVIGADDALLPWISSANIACGFHAGDPAVMRRTVAAARAHGVAIGAHPGLPDLAGFGRSAMTVTPDEVHDMVVYQVGALLGFVQAAQASEAPTGMTTASSTTGTTATRQPPGARAPGARDRAGAPGPAGIQGLAHVKAHGALYNMAARDRALAEAIAAAVRDVDPSLILFGLAGSELIGAGERAGLSTAAEAFADRNYLRDGSLVPRARPDSLVADPGLALERVLRMVRAGKVRSVEGADVALRADTICIHGDGPHAVELARALGEGLRAEGIVVVAPGVSVPAGD